MFEFLSTIDGIKFYKATAGYAIIRVALPLHFRPVLGYSLVLCVYNEVKLLSDVAVFTISFLYLFHVKLWPWSPLICLFSKTVARSVYLGFT